MSLKDPNIVDPKNRKKVAIVLSNAAVSSTNVRLIGELDFDCFIARGRDLIGNFRRRSWRIRRLTVLRTDVHSDPFSCLTGGLGWNILSCGGG